MSLTHLGQSWGQHDNSSCQGFLEVESVQRGISASGPSLVFLLLKATWLPIVEMKW